MKNILVTLLLVFSMNIHAAAVDGELFYKKPNGDIATRSVTIEVPARGQGEVVLRNDKFEWKTTEFKTIKKNNRTIFIALFETSFLFFFKSTIGLKGSYINGNNKILYFGDMYKKKGHGISIKDVKGRMKEFDHIGGFRFEYLK